MSLLDEIQNDMQREIEKDLPFTLTIDVSGTPTAIPCVPSTQELGTQIQVGPTLVEVAESFTVRIQSNSDDTATWNFTSALPESGELVTFDSRSLRIALVKKVLGKYLTIVCVDPNR